MTTAASMRAIRLRPSIARPSSLPNSIRISSRHASTASETATNARSTATRTKNLIYGTLLTFGLSFGYLYVTDTRASVHQWLVVPALRQIYPDGEEAHHAGSAILKALHSFGLNPRERGNPDAQGDLSVEIFGHVLSNPIGTSAGIDKGAEVPTPLLDLGAGIVEVGGVTPLPQPGNPKPRVFRLPSQNALINRYGFNSEGAETVAMRLRHRVREFAYHMGLGIDEEAERKILNGDAGVPPGSLTPGRLMAVQITKNKDTPEGDIEAVKRDYSFCVQHLGKYADIIVVNVSSPNTPGLRSLQNVEPLTHLLTSVVKAVKQVDRKVKPAIMVKVSPDEDSEEQITGICEAVWDSGVDGVIVGNTTKKRPDPLPKGYALPAKEAQILLEQGGYSGPQMFERTLALVKKYRKTLDDGPRQAPPPPPSPPQTEETPSPVTTTVAETLDSAKSNAKDITSSLSTTTPTPSESTPSNVDDLAPSAPTLSLPPPTSTSSPAPAPNNPRKVLFATGGITNGRQAREILDSGASVAMVYTALIYGGVGTISRIKREMRDDAAAAAAAGEKK
ncbi:FMN-linked oxidoreductase [Aaosphaeria arxii CBS 175.79]|uniref:Dihydroorotate dehydrogenase (quinone), mitochondrial n=1 Tax=Aaosphaeria arxii CBS 175.79 TaxID=1450172 RepID=A0A6A5Y3M9_9PLEO|nr:FMN-linked oxidoreductase [Aaosphaeria arxii CBS 175.79]KAF2019420.1 FMN-linked oxidoreductase [Aaosphaeria arxii CBS 175.79]